MTAAEIVHRPYDERRRSRLAGNYVAACSRCREVCAYWDADDLDEDGNLWHACTGGAA